MEPGFRRPGPRAGIEQHGVRGFKRPLMFELERPERVRRTGQPHGNHGPCVGAALVVSACWHRGGTSNGTALPRVGLLERAAFPWAAPGQIVASRHEVFGITAEN